MSELHIVVLAAGQGTRMRSALPKVLHELAGRPLLAHVVDTAGRLAPAQIHVVYGHGGETVRRLLHALPVNWVEQSQPLGTGHAVKQALAFIPERSTVLVLYGDVPLTRVQTLRSAVEAARERTVALVSVVLENPTGYGRILRDCDGRVTEIVEHADASEAVLQLRECNSGILAASAADLGAWLARVKPANRQNEEYLTDVIAIAASSGAGVETVAATSADEVLGVNDRVQLAHLERVYQRAKAEELMRGGVTLADPSRLDVRGHVEAAQDAFIDVNVILEGEVRLGHGVRIGPNCVISDCELGAGTEVYANCVLEKARIGSDARIGPYARLRPGTDLADQVHIGNFVEIKNATIGKGSKANHLSYIGDASIGSQVNVGAGTITCNYDGARKHRTIVGDRVFIGSGVELVAPITVHDDATIGAGSTLSRDAPPGQLTLTRSRQTTIAGWRRPAKKPSGS